MEINIRPAISKDLDAIANIFTTSVRTLCSADYTNEQIEAIITSFYEQLYLLEIEISVGTVFVAEAESIVGFASFNEGGKAINDLFVHPDYVRQRIGTLLLSTIERAALARQVSRLWVMSSLTGRPFYESRGYKYVRDSVLIDSKIKITVPCVDLVKVLSRNSNFKGDNRENYGDLSTLTVPQFIKLGIKTLLVSSK